jgi:hypothetical protein
LWKDAPEQRVEDFLNGARSELRLYGFAVVKEVASMRKQMAGTMGCPLCQQVLQFAVAGNGHLRVKCTTINCISAVE